MAEHKPIDASHNGGWVPPPPDDKKPTENLTPHCVACGQVHGSVVKQRRCPEDFIKLLNDRYPKVYSEIRGLLERRST